MMRPYIGSWKRLAVSGVAAVLFGLATLVWPDVTLWALVVLWGAFVFVDGITALSAAITDRFLLNRGWVAFWGVTGIAAGVVTFLWPSITALALLARDRDVVAARRRLPDRLRHQRPASRSPAHGPSRSAASSGAPRRAPRHQPGDGSARHHLGDRLARHLFGGLQLWLASSSATRRATRPPAGDPPRSPSTRRADMTPAAAAPARHAPRRRPPAAGGGARRRRSAHSADGGIMNAPRRGPDPAYRPVLVPLDGSHFADGAIPTAGALAARFGATVHTVTVAVCRLRARTASGPKPPAHSAPNPTTHASTSRSTPTSPAPSSAGLRARLLPGLPVDPRSGPSRRHAGRIDRTRHHRTRPPPGRRRRPPRRPPRPRQDGDPTTRGRPPRRLRRRDPGLRTRAAGRRSLGARARHEAHDRHRRRAVPAARPHRRPLATPSRTQRGRRRVHPPSRRTMGA